MKKNLKKIIKLLIPDSLKKNIILKISQSSILSGIYFGTKKSFFCIQKALINGTINYQKIKNDSQTVPIYSLIRNIHRIEKGISMQNRKEIFADRYIKEVIRDLNKVMSNIDKKYYSDEQIAWSFDVLHKYFEVVKRNETINQALDEFNVIVTKYKIRFGTKYPYKKSESVQSGVAYESLKKLAQQRRSVRWFLDKTVSPEEIDKALEIALLSPSACNRQPFEFLIYNKHEVVQKITDLSIGMTGYKDNVPCVVVVVGKYRPYFDYRDVFLPYIDASLAVMSFQFALETLGLSSTCVNWPSIPEREEKMKRLLKLQDDEKVILLMAVGYPNPNGYVLYSAKKNINKIRFFNKEIKT